MKNILLKSLVIITLLGSNSIFSQQIEDDVVLNISRSVTNFDSRSKSLVGSSYIVEDFSPAKILKSGNVYDTRFNVYQDEMEIKKDGKDYSLPKNFDNSVYFMASKKTYKVFKYEFNNTEKIGFFVELSKNDKISLLLKERIVLKDEVKPSTGYDEYKPPTLKRIKDKLYVGYKNNTTAVLPSKKKDFYAIFSSKSKEIEKFVKSSGLNIKKPEDLVKIFAHYDSLK